MAKRGNKSEIKKVQITNKNLSKDILKIKQKIGIIEIITIILLVFTTFFTAWYVCTTNKQLNETKTQTLIFEKQYNLTNKQFVILNQPKLNIEKAYLNKNELSLEIQNYGALPANILKINITNKNGNISNLQMNDTLGANSLNQYSFKIDSSKILSKEIKVQIGYQSPLSNSEEYYQSIFLS